jgi:hypothetical protein
LLPQVARLERQRSGQEKGPGTADGSRLKEFDATVSQDPSAINHQRLALA